MKAATGCALRGPVCPSEDVRRKRAGWGYGRFRAEEPRDGARRGSPPNDRASFPSWRSLSLRLVVQRRFSEHVVLSGAFGIRRSNGNIDLFDAPPDGW